MAADIRRKRAWMKIVGAMAIATVAARVLSRDATHADSNEAGKTDGSAHASSAASGEQDEATSTTTTADGQDASLASTASETSVTVAAAPTIASATPRVGETINGATEAELRRAGEKRNVEQAAFYREAAKIPSTNRVLPAGRDPLVESSSASKASTPAMDGHSLELAVSDWSIVAGGTTQLTATLRDPEGNVVPIASARAMLMDTAMSGYEEILPMQIDKVSGTGTVAFVAPDETTVARDPGVHKLVLEAIDAKGQTYLSTSALQVSNSAVMLTGRLRESLDQGGLVVEAEVRAIRKTRAHLAMTLAVQSNVDGARVLAQTSTVLTPGVQWVRLRFAGVTMHALHEGGPYVVTAVQLHDTTTMPPARMPLLRPGFVTAAYGLDAFDVTPSHDAWLETMARFLENR